MNIRDLCHQSVEGVYFLRAALADYTDENNLADIIREINYAIDATKKIFRPRFTFYVRPLMKKLILRVMICNGQEVLTYVELDYVKDVLQTHTEPMVKNPNQGLSYRRLVRRLKPSVVVLNDEQSAELCEYLNGYQGLFKAFLSELRFDIEVLSNSLKITSKDGRNVFDCFELSL